MHLKLDDSDDYKPSLQLLAAINTALFLKRPLLLSGEPGTGKTICADFVARQLAKQCDKQFKADKALRFNVKSVSQSTDLFYSYDAVSHFGDQGKKSKEAFITFNSLGVALLATKKEEKEEEQALLKFCNYKNEIADKEPPFGSVVLIDEIDKAPRDFPNDLLAELEKPPFKFSIKELPGFEKIQDANLPVVIIITSNNEKGLPDAFLRRCVFHYIDFPDETQLANIVKANLKDDLKGDNVDTNLAYAVNLFMQLRNAVASKPPATSELVDWVKVLQDKQLFSDSLKNWESAGSKFKISLKETLGILAKNRGDLDKLIAKIGV